MTAPASAATHIGKVRRRNEDAYAVADAYWIVADGLGGHPGGGVASRVAADAAAQVLASLTTEAVGEQGRTVADAVTVAHAAVREAASADRSLHGMGTTIVAAALIGDGVQVASVGDSRCYLLDESGLRQLTRDDNLAEEYFAAGVITADEARSHPGQFVLTRALLANETSLFPPQQVSVRGPGRLLLCTDGLNAELDDVTIAALLGRGQPADACAALVEQALANGGSDNVTVIVVDL